MSPLAVASRKEAVSVSRQNVKSLIEGAVGEPHAQGGVEDEQRLPRTVSRCPERVLNILASALGLRINDHHEEALVQTRPHQQHYPNQTRRENLWAGKVASRANRPIFGGPLLVLHPGEASMPPPKLRSSGVAVVSHCHSPLPSVHCSPVRARRLGELTICIEFCSVK